MTGAIVLQAKLETQHADEMRKVRALERERSALTLPAHSGDANARKRLNAIRHELAEASDLVLELDQAMTDIVPSVRQEQAANARAALEREAARLARVGEAMQPWAAKADEALAALVEASRHLSALMTEGRRGMAALCVPITPGADVGTQVINQLLALDTSGSRPLPELLLERLATLGLVPLETVGGFSPRSPALEQSTAELRFVMQVKIDDVLKQRGQPVLIAEDA